MKQLYSYRHLLFAIPFAMATVSYCMNTTEYMFQFKHMISIALAVVFLNNVLAGVRLKYARKLKRSALENNNEFPQGWLNQSNAKSFTIINGLLYFSSTWFISRLIFALSPLALLIFIFFEFKKLKRSIRVFVSTYWPTTIPLAVWIVTTSQIALVPTILTCIIIFSTWGYVLLQPSYNPHSPSTRHHKSSIFLHALSFVCAIGLAVYTKSGFAGWLGALLFGATLSTFHLHDKYLLSARSKTLSFYAYLVASAVINGLFIYDWSR